MTNNQQNERGDGMCEHQEFSACVEVNRIAVKDGESPTRYSADIKIKCVSCGVAMRFLGLPMGLDPNGAAVGPLGTEARLAIHPVGSPLPEHDDCLPAGFRIYNTGGQA